MEGLSADESAALLDSLYSAATAEANLYRHTWLRGDVVIWDNALVMHKALPARGRKVTYRVTTSTYR
ncbi:TauD/TfdA family dioxygenase [Frankia sp. Ag45/Mut15]|uniref:TauD/TfdA family dioxygenase n=1 Tax=Frankia umida TaxID=573489 RepID=A0ABT0K5L2_9ACTN|nr:TauD/TfdA family dioxygenase [Frankia umida]MCK9879091.1 TauD/TfdA family dioxygenase [Frankia umida]